MMAPMRSRVVSSNDKQIRVKTKGDGAIVCSVTKGPERERSGLGMLE